MPRTSRAEIDMQPLVTPPPVQALHIPDELETDEERALYRHLFSENPSAHLFSKSVEPLAVAYVRHTLSANAINKAVQAVDPAKEPRLFLAMLKSQKDETMALSQIASKLKLGGASISTHRGNLLKKNDGPKPWEWDG